MALNVNEMKQQRMKIVEEMRKAQDTLAEKGSETQEETERFSKMEADIRGLEKIIAREETILAAEAEGARRSDAAVKGGSDKLLYPQMAVRQASAAERSRRVNIVLHGWLQAGKRDANLTPEHHEAAKFMGINLQSREIALDLRTDVRNMKNEFRNMSLTVTTGGYTIPEGFMANLEIALLAFGGMRQVSDVIRTTSGNDLPWPNMNDSGNKGAIIAEETSISTSVDPTFGVLTLKAFKYHSKPILVSNELLEDSAFDLGGQIGGWLGERIGRIQNDHFSTGAGSTLPKGISIAGTAGKTATATNTFTDVEVIDLQHSLDPAYRPGAIFMMHDTVLAAVRKLKDTSTGQYLWQPGLQGGAPDRLLGHPYVINQSLASAFTTAQKLMYFGDFSKYKIRDVNTVRMIRLDELYAATDQVGFDAFLRTDGNLADAGTHPIVYMKLA